MFVTLLFSECRQLLKSITYYIFLICMVLFFVTQLQDFELISKPEVSDSDFGKKHSTDKDIIMSSTLTQLAREYNYNQYTTYPIGFYKEVILTDSKQEKIVSILAKSSGMTVEELKKMFKDYNDNQVTTESGYTIEMINGEGLKIQPYSNLTYEDFLKNMKEADEIIGGGSSYTKVNVSQNAEVPMTYEDAMENYNGILYKDHVSGAYARLFSDYMVIILGILPVFLAVTRCLRDRRSQIFEVIYSKKMSSFKIIFSRYFALVLMILIPLLLLSISPLLQSLYYAESIGIHGDSFAFVKYIIGWIMPTILMSLSVGFFFTELTNKPFGIFVQIIFWILSLFSGIGNLIGHVGWNLMPRFNTLGSYEVYNSVFSDLVYNRLMFTAISFVLLVLTVITYELKRKGVLKFYGKVFQYRKSQSKD
ncbi:ABC transporter permease [[Clostridium] fimetarium]|uniref:ABC-2 family transporter protein n=1 Tax=[Clostridium] fimetarium TaxID=99656 RepID=A0A1I0NG31_9FIRM|nr:ABC transporter permease [[Clostridium] fimetarium]SEW00211.1 ABC-2 family transporter protein [[Clostridium] fimetarium]